MGLERLSLHIGYLMKFMLGKSQMGFLFAISVTTLNA